MTIGAADRAAISIDEEERQRAKLYALLSRLLASPPDETLLALLRSLEGGDTPLGRALAGVAREAAAVSQDAAAEEYAALFIGLVRGELVPYGSYYLTGFLHEKPLARLRDDMAVLGIARAEGVAEPEDHIAALCAMMAGLIEGRFTDIPVAVGEQRRFFDAHLAPWVRRFFEDLQKAESARFYRTVGALGREFMDIELQAFAMAA